MRVQSRFWEILSSVPRLARSGSRESVERMLQDAAECAVTIQDGLALQRRALLEQMAEVYGVSITIKEENAKASPRAPGVSVVTCSRNRNENLIKALPSWLSCREVDEIIIVDWSSGTPVAEDLVRANINDERIRVLRVEGEPRWILSHPFNLGFQNARFDKILKADADIVLAPGFFRRNVLQLGEFVAGNWRKASEDQAHVNGFFYVWAEALTKAGGFNEYITTYGWDDDELYGRLQEDGLLRTDVASNSIFHLPHDNEARTDKAPPPADAPASETLPTQTLYLIRRNRQLSNLMPTWNETRRPVEYDVVQRTGANTVLRRRQASGETPPAIIEREASLAAARELLAWRLGEVCYGLDHNRTERLVETLAWDEIDAADVTAMLAEPVPTLTKDRRWLFIDARVNGVKAASQLDSLTKGAAGHDLKTIWIGEPPANYIGSALREAVHTPPAEAVDFARLERSDALNDRAYLFEPKPKALSRSAPLISTPKAKLFVDGQHGLGNRLRAIGSAAAIAQATGRELVIVWEPDDHCDCRFSDLFEHFGSVIESAFPQDAAQSGLDVYNYMEIEEGAEKDKLVKLVAGRDAYLRSAYVLKHPSSTWEQENDFLKSLRPVDSVMELIDAVRWPNDLSAHIRMVGGKQFEHLAWEAADNWTEEGHDLVDQWRTKSHYSNFINRIDALVASGDVSSMFVAADMPETYDVFRERYGDRVCFLPRTVNDRSAEQLKYALADAILLSRAPRMLGSTWSSFSELAQRLSGVPMKVEMSGTDF